MIDGDGVRLRRAESGDVEFLAALLGHPEVEPFIAAMARRDPEALAEDVARSAAEPDDLGRFVIELEEDGAWRRVGSVGFSLRSRHSRIAYVEQLAIHPDEHRRGVGLAAARLLQHYLLHDLGYHRLEIEVYGFNERAIAHAERCGFVLEGRKRQAYFRHGRWVDGVLFGLLADDLD